MLLFCNFHSNKTFLASFTFTALNLFGLHLEIRNKKLDGLYSACILIGLLLSGSSVYANINETFNLVIKIILYINYSSLFITLIFVYFQCFVMKKREIIKKLSECFGKIYNILGSNYFDCSKSLKLSTSIVLSCFILIFASDFFCNGIVSYAQCIFVIFSLVLTLEILFYCMLVDRLEFICHSVKKYLRSINFVHVENKKGKLLLTDNLRQMSQLNKLSMIYDEVLEIISLLNSSFSVLLSFALSKYHHVKWQFIHHILIILTFYSIHSFTFSKFHTQLISHFLHFEYKKLYTFPANLSIVMDSAFNNNNFNNMLFNREFIKCD